MPPAKRRIGLGTTAPAFFFFLVCLFLFLFSEQMHLTDDESMEEDVDAVDVAAGSCCGA